MSLLRFLAQELGTSERTLRRAVAEGMIRAQRPGPRLLQIPLPETHYLADHWETLSELRVQLRTARDVRLAVLFGSYARGDDTSESDLDLMVELKAPRQDLPAKHVLAEKLSKALGREVDVVELAQAERSPSLFSNVLEEGRVLVDRTARWPELKARREEVTQRCDRLRQRAWLVGALTQ